MLKKSLFMLLMFPLLCSAETSLWKISKNGNTLYLGGTIHVLKKEDYPLPKEFNDAFQRSDKLVLETNIDSAQTPQFSQKMTQMLSYPPGKSLKSEITEETYNTLKKYLMGRGIPIESFLRYTPQMIVLFITTLELKRMGMVDIGVDQFFYNKAQEVGKTREYFETIDEQLEFLRTMGKGYEDEMLLSSINDMNQMQAAMKKIKSAWLKGSEQELIDVGLIEMQRDYPSIYQSLLVKRNNNWMPQIEKMLKNKAVEIILVGALHLVGKDGLLQQLRDKGYSVKQF